MAYEPGRIAEKYPQLAYLAGHPEIGPILRQAVDEDWSPERFQAALRGTNWWKTTSSAQRRWEDLTEVDNATARRMVEGTIPQIRDTAIRMGVDPARLDPNTLWTLADAFHRYGWTDSELRANLANMIGVGGGAPGSEYAAISAQVKELAADWMVPVDEPTIAHWVREIAAGRADMQGVAAHYRTQAAALRPHMKAMFDQGITLRQYAQPLLNTAAQLLEMSPSALTLDDPRWAVLIDQPDGKGGFRPMTITEAAKWARSQPEFRRTRQARDQVAELGDQIARMMGKKAS